MFKVYVKSETSFDGRKHVGDFDDYDKAFEKVDNLIEEDKDVKYIVEETNGKVNIYGDLVVEVIDEN